ncbi:hypothetical protein D7X98_12370 [bacterium 1XD8-76]|nr:hypothetical protein D7X98_12370 [bacterium 1XD8-76]
MNRRQKKKAFKKRFGFNPPRGISIRTATRIMEHKETIIAIFERLKAAILNLWEQVKKPALELGEVLKEIHTAFITPAEKRRRQYIAVEDFRTKLLLRQQESEAKRIEGNSDIHNHDRR